jgi:hypothetical protein
VTRQESTSVHFYQNTDSAWRAAILRDVAAEFDSGGLDRGLELFRVTALERRA